MVSDIDRFVYGTACKLDAARKALGMTQLQLAESAGMGQSSVSQILAGKMIRTDTLWRLADAMGYTLRVVLEPKAGA